ncbi:MAG: tRNA (adenosine(37)-N6)-threonylcarbamoyltransferase complex ATPase subunit type 1 TsaE [Actinobacteria bacterium]|nr:tRNA (adenosine(37)-N6)-threonylcarbamoyltransferase complex ATPase subunit type 1 TsaE [Actinomycetota bacterium]
MRSSGVIELASSSAEETERIAAAVAGELRVGDVVTVAGELGAGKTTFVRGACRALGVTTAVTSPTYTIGNVYDGRVRVSHLDLYRLSAVTEADWADLEPYFEDVVAFVEWPEVGEPVLPLPRLRVRLRHAGRENRFVVLESDEKNLENTLSASVC